MLREWGTRGSVCLALEARRHCIYLAKLTRLGKKKLFLFRYRYFRHEAAHGI